MAHGGQLAARAFKNMGTDCVFTLSGGHIMPIYAGCLDEGIRIIDVRHEQATTHAADAWSRLNPGKVGIAIVTAGPGVTDSVTGVANAWRANSPILIIGGQGPFVNIGRGSLQEMDHVALMRPITKWAGACYDTARIPEYIDIAVRHAITGIPGPSFLEIPMDILMGDGGDIDKAVFPPTKTRPPLISPQRDEAVRALELIQASKKPMMMVGTSVKWSNAQQEVLKFLERTNIPAYANGMGRGAIPRGSKYLFNRTRRDAMKNCDVIILAGCLLDFRMRFGQSIPKDAKIVQLEMDNTLIGHNRPSDAALVGNLACSFQSMLQVIEEDSIELDFSAYSAELRAKEDEQEAALAGAASSDEVPITMPRFCQDVASFVSRDEDMIVIGDG
ncbi:MAG: hypothetical protein IIB38_15325, partial [Candidatus Hydrogenedentes bacterium]|nr:hypothetical protein [Candidatus Hydrogenedentota bacterium]